VADRIITFAEIVGQENVIAGTDCGLGGRVHPQIAWAKLRALRPRGDREQEVVELNSKVPVRDERNKKQGSKRPLISASTSSITSPPQTRISFGATAAPSSWRWTSQASPTSRRISSAPRSARASRSYSPTRKKLMKGLPRRPRQLSSFADTRSWDRPDSLTQAEYKGVVLNP
jgi:hypothetical protein